MPKYDIGYGPLNGPREATGGLGEGPATKPIIKGKTKDAPEPTAQTLTIPNLAITATPYLGEHRHLEARAEVTWDPPPAGESQTELNQVEKYEIHHSVGNGYSKIGAVEIRDVIITGLPVKVQLVVQVRAVTGEGVRGPWATATIITPDTTVAPPVPSAPSVYGTMRGGFAVWDGTFADGSQPPPNFQYVECQLSLDPSFANHQTVTMSPGGVTAVCEFGHAPFTIYGRLRAMNTSGVFSGWSLTGQGGSIPIIPADVGEKAITTKALADAAVTADQILNRAITSLKLGYQAVTSDNLSDLSVNVDKIVDGAVSARKTALAAIDSSSGTLAAYTVNAININGQIINSEMIVTDAIIARHVVAGEIISEKIGANAITADKLHALSVYADAMQANSVRAGTIAAGAVIAGTIVAGIVGADEITGYEIQGKHITGSTLSSGVYGEDRVEMVAASGLYDALRWYRGYDNNINGEIRGYLGDIGVNGLHLNANVEIGNTQSTIYQVGRRDVSNGNVRVRAGRSNVTTPEGGSVRIYFQPGFPSGAVPHVSATCHFAGANATPLEIGNIGSDGFDVAFSGFRTDHIGHVAATRDVTWFAEWFV